MATIYLDDKAMNGRDAILKELKLDLNTLPGSRRKEFEVLGGKRDKDGNLRISKSIYGVAEYTVHVPMLGRDVRVRLATSQRANKDKGFDYFPKNIGIEPAEDGSVLITDELEFLFWFLRPMCRQSPFRKRHSKVFYEFKDLDAKAVLEGKLEEAKIDAMSMIYGVGRKTMKELREIAKGMNLPGVDDMTDAVVQSTLKKEANADPVAFYNRATSREIIFSGKIQEAIDTQVLQVKMINGMKRWYLLETEILPLQHGMDDIAALKEFLSAQWYLYSDSIQNAIDQVSISSSLNNPANDAAFAEQEDHVVPQSTSEMSASLQAILKEIEEKPYLKEKVIRLSTVDLEDPSLHVATRKSYDANRHYVEAYLESQKGL